MSEPSISGPWLQLLNDVLAGKYDRSEDVVRRIVELGHSDTRESAADAPKPAKSSPEERLARIAEAHSKNVSSFGGMTDGLCIECYQTHPCPTFAWATDNQRHVLDTWDPADDDPERPWL